jgi:hypothetical protein
METKKRGVFETLNIPSRPYTVTQFSPSTSLAQALKIHWREYMMEAAELGVLMFCICLFGTLYSSASPLDPLGLSRIDKAFLMGFAVATTPFLIIRSPFGRRTGAHFNPAITLTYFQSWPSTPLGHALLLCVSVRWRCWSSYHFWRRLVHSTGPKRSMIAALLSGGQNALGRAGDHSLRTSLTSMK